MAVYIVAVGFYCENVTDELPQLKKQVVESVGTSIRRVGRFIQLALIGAGRASQGLPKDSSVYLTSSRGDMEVTVEVLENLYRDQQPPRPLNFINTVSNAACFYIAQSLGLQGASHFICNRYFAMESILQVAVLELDRQELTQQSSLAKTILVGVVDVVVNPLSDHRRRLGLKPSAKIAEGSHWLQLTNQSAGRTVLARLELVQHFSDRNAVSTWLLAQSFVPGSCLAIGQYIDAADVCDWLVSTGLQHYSYCEDIGHFGSQAGRVFCQFVSSGSGQLIYLNSDRHGRYMVVVINRD